MLSLATNSNFTEGQFVNQPTMASTESHVWVGFIEGLPVVSSVREAVEWVLAVAADDLPLAEEKLKVITARLEEGDKLKEFKSLRSSSGYSSDSTSASSSASLPSMHVESIPEMDLMAHIVAVGQKNKGKKADESVQDRARKKEVQEVQDETLKKIRLIDKTYKFPENERLDDYGQRSGRGEHVINNNVIKIYRKVVREHFNQDIDMACPLDDDTANAIMYELVVHFDIGELYINANALIYGEYCRRFKEASKAFLTNNSQENRKRVDNIVHHMNEERKEAYVDPYAKAKWIGNQERRRDRFQAIRNKVATMFNNWAEYFAKVKDGLDGPSSRTVQ
ncbi:uncharacterized protein LOC121688115 isoform X1 [Alosa sapidissima]|uniref:uncharacterized protein LOC121688115 isoform X1 n=1 Tax=Alosa sapidissima TaxID=34773 RepID=UPI001C09C1FF|nr:uncharacterized protein LOC121688115 isoform X1 [Alosa sapidissima]XP_041923428.1 uncharacterized protein LOC121688115 isoform X1 [Alosa sapidissima]